MTETDGVTGAIELIFVILLPTAVGYAVLGSIRACRWAAERRSRRRARTHPVTAEPIERLAARMRRLRAELEATETRTDVPAKGMRLRAIRGAYLDLMRVACERLDVSPRRPVTRSRRPTSTAPRPRCAAAAWTSGKPPHADPPAGTGSHQFAAYDHSVVRVLAVSDVVEEGLWADVGPVRGADLILGCGDLPFEYLGYLMNALDVPLVFVPGNHDPDLSGYRLSRAGLTLRAGLPARPPWPDGAVSADGRVVDVAGLRIAGLGGCRRYRPGPNQYTDRQQARRARRLAARIGLHGMTLRQARGGPRRERSDRLDVLLTHAPPRGVGDGPDPVHQGFPALNVLAGRLRPPLLLHGHVDPDPARGRDHQLGRTLVRNVTGWQLFDFEPATEQVADVTGHHSAGHARAGQTRAGQTRASYNSVSDNSGGYRDAR